MLNISYAEAMPSDNDNDLFDPVTFGRRVKEKADKVGGLRPAAKETGLHFTTVARVAKGKPPSVEHYFRLMKWLTGRAPRQ
jgi:hypothetical protein